MTSATDQVGRGVLLGAPRRPGLIDLHTHSSCSDGGTQTPTELVEAAAARGITVLGLTDHDTLAGIEEAAHAATTVSISLLPGMEVSTRNEGRSQHLLVYAIDTSSPGYAAFDELIQLGIDSRERRVPKMVEQLRAKKLDITEAAVRGKAGSAPPGRPHVADALVDIVPGLNNRTEAFKKYMDVGKPGYVERFVPDIVDVIKAATAAGGVCVIAHPAGRKSHVSWQRFGELEEAGLAGIEVDHQEHNGKARIRLRAIATVKRLIITGSSDHHGTGKINHDLACNETSSRNLDRILALRRRFNS